MAINLSRNTKLFVSSLGNVDTTNRTDSNTFEVPILDGYSFSQEADSQTITLNEAGDAPVRGQKIFNTAINPGDISFSTYVRPYADVGDAGNEKCLEMLLWEGLVGPGSGTDTAPLYRVQSTTADMRVDFQGSNVHELLGLFLFFWVDNTIYKASGVTIQSAEIDFSIDAIAMINWTAQCTSLEELSTADYTTFTAWADGTGANTNYQPATGVHTGTTDPVFIKNKLSSISLTRYTGTEAEGYQTSTMSVTIDPTADAYPAAGPYLCTIAVDGGTAQNISVDGTTATYQDVVDQINYQLVGATASISADKIVITSNTSGSTGTILITDDAGASKTFGSLNDYSTLDAAVAGTGTAKTYNVPITGGSLTIENNVTFLVPEELGKVNQSIGSFTGTRAISGNMTAYLNTGANNTGGLLADLISDTATVTHDFDMIMSMGGAANVPRVDFRMSNAHLVIPSINVEDVISTEINFTALGSDITQADELEVTYISS